MTPGRKRSSRKRMESRNNKRRKTPTLIPMKDGSVIAANRMAKRKELSWIAHAPGRSAAQENREKRRRNEHVSRAALREMRKETRAVMKRAAGL